MSRLLDDGSTDASFGSHGTTVVHLGAMGGVFEAPSFAIAGPRIVVADNQPEAPGAVWAFSGDGAIDPSFGDPSTPGKATLTGSVNFIGTDVLVDTLHRIYLPINDGVTPGNGAGIERFTPGGLVDSSYGQSGIVWLGSDESSRTASAATIDSADRVTIEYVDHYRNIVTRLLADGSRDPSFAPLTNHIVVVSLTDNPRAIATASDGSTFVVSYAQHSTVPTVTTTIQRLSPNGDPLPMGGDSSPISLPAYVSSLATDPSGHVIIAWPTTGATGVASLHVRRFLASGAVDTSFDSTGPTPGTVNFADDTINLFPAAVGVDTVGRTLVAGGQRPANDNAPIIARMLDAGITPSSPDPPTTTTAPTPPSTSPITPAHDIVSVVPVRLLESRIGPGLSTVDGGSNGIGMRPAGSVTELQIAGRGGVPAGAVAAMLNITAVDPRQPGFVTAFPCGTTRPNASTVNFPAGLTVSNAALTKLSPDGRVCLFTYSDTDLVIDTTSYVNAGASSIVSVVPVRLLESRIGPGLSTVDGGSNGIGMRPAGSVTELQIAGRGGVPAGAVAAMLNITAVDPRQPGFVTAFPCGTTRPNASTVNFPAGLTVSNAALTKLSPDGRVCLFTYSDTDLVIDTTSYVNAGASSIVSVVPVRLLESRIGPGLSTVDGGSNGIGMRPAGSVTELQIAGRGGVPAGAVAAMLNITAVDPRQPGFVTAFPCGTTRPNASTVNFPAGLTVSNAALTKLSPDGRVCLFTYSDTDLVIDTTSYVNG